MLLGSVHILIFVVNLVAVAVLRQGAPYVNPFTGPETIRAFFALNPAAVRIGSWLVPWANYLIPAARYLGFIWLMVVAVKLPQSPVLGSGQGAAE